MGIYRIVTISKTVLLLSLFFVLANNAYAEQTDRVVRIGIYNNPPLVFRNSEGDPKGLFIDILNEIASQKGWKPEFIFDTFSSSLNQLRKNELDLLAAIAHTEERDKFLDFSKEIVCILWGTVYVQPDSEIQTILDLDGKKIAVMKKGIFGKKFKKLCNDFNIKCVIQETSSQSESLTLLKENKVDAAIFNNAFKEVYNESGIRKTSIIYSPLKICFAVNKDKNADLLDNVDSLLKKWKETGDSIYYQVLKRWLGVIEVPKKVIPNWLFFTLISFGGLLILAFVLSWTLQRQIAERKQVEKTLRKTTHDLIERAKELNCLYGIAELVARENISLDKICQGTVDLIPPSMQYPEITCARLILYEQVYQTDNLKETEWKQSRDIFVKNKHVGVLDIYYLEEMEESFEGPFLKEEMDLINIIAQRLGDIIGTKQAEELLQKSEKRLSLALVVGNVGMWDWDISTGELIWSDETYKIFGFFPGECKPSFELLLDMVHADDKDQLEQTIETAQYHEQYDTDCRIILRDGRTRVVNTHGEITFDAEDRPLRMIGTFQDITERKKMETEMSQNINDLERFSSMAVGREEQMIELKKEVNNLLKKSGRDKKYKIV